MGGSVELGEALEAFAMSVEVTGLNLRGTVSWGCKWWRGLEAESGKTGGEEWDTRDPGSLCTIHSFYLLSPLGAC